MRITVACHNRDALDSLVCCVRFFAKARTCFILLTFSLCLVTYHLLCVLNLPCDFGNPSRSSSLVLQHSRNSLSSSFQLVLAFVSSFRLPPHIFLCSLLPSGNAVALVTHVLIDTTHVRVATVASNRDAVVCSHTYTHDVVFSITSQILEPIHTSLHVRVVGDQDAIHVLIRVRQRSPSSPKVFPHSVCVFHSIT